jgi:hypothetical protein
MRVSGAPEEVRSALQQDVQVWSPNNLGMRLAQTLDPAIMASIPTSQDPELFGQGIVATTGTFPLAVTLWTRASMSL